MSSDSVTYIITDKDLIFERLQSDSRFRLVDRENHHWLFLDSPPQISKYGIMSFGDVDIKEGGSLRLETLSHNRMKYLRDIIEDMYGNALSIPFCEEGELVTIPKPRRD